MDSSAIYGIVTYSVIAGLTLLTICIILYLAFGPTQYNPYRHELIENLPEDGAAKPKQDPNAGYAYFARGSTANKRLRTETSVQIVVLGDIGRSPRMQYHAISLAKHGARVDLIGFSESELHPELQGNRLVQVVPLSPSPALFRTTNKLLFVVTAPFKVLWQTLNLFYILIYGTKPAKWMLIQNPPSIPVMLIALLACWMRNTKLVIDWHNFGWSVLALRLGRSHPLVAISKLYEEFVARGAEYHLTVTAAMAAYIKKFITDPVLPLHDRPAAIFQPLSAAQRSSTLRRLETTSVHAMDIEKGNWRLLVSATSWTADEDFSLLLDALVKYSERAANDSTLPSILAIITGKGPQQAYYIRKIQQLSQANKLSKVLVRTTWLSFDDYAKLLGSADLGISLHKSTSGLDLPMKVVDMLGTGLPVAGYSKYASWPELVQDGVNGCDFTTADELEELLVKLLGEKAARLKTLREGALKEGSKRWDQEWDAVAGKEVFRIGHLLDGNTTKSN